MLGIEIPAPAKITRSAFLLPSLASSTSSQRYAVPRLFSVSACAS
jgi:hypothetical protein